MALGVVDASVVVKWFLEEDFSEEARRLRDDHASGLLELQAPSLLPYEVLNAAKFADVFSASELLRIAEAVDGMGIPLHPPEGHLSRSTMQLASLAHLTIYDASYLALAQDLKVPIYSADDALIRASGGGIDTRHIRSYRGTQR
jgi:predicted nucleic acid-binding protein